MKKTFVRVLVLMLACVMLLGMMAGCTGEDDRRGPVNVRDPYTEPITTDPITITIMTKRHAGTTNDAEDLWFFKYMEYWYAQYGYNVTINVTQAGDPTEQTLLLLGSDSLPDIMWGMTLSEATATAYGVEDNLILDWAPYLNEMVMPNIYKRFQDDPAMLAESTAPDGAVLTLPYIAPAMWHSSPHNVQDGSGLFVRQSWLDACNLDMPTTEKEFFDMLRAFKKLKGPSSVPLADTDMMLEYYLWTCLGYYGGASKYGTSPAIKDGKVVLPCMTEDYRTYIKFMNTLFTEGLIDSRYFSTLSSSAVQAMAASGKLGVFGDWTLGAVGKDYKDYVALPPIPMGGNDDCYLTRLSWYTTGSVWASSKTEYPEVVAMMIDFIYSDEGAFLYRYGPKQGEDPLNLLDGWYYDKNGDITYTEVENGTYANIQDYQRQLIYPIDTAGVRPVVVTSGSGETLTYKDAVTGEDISAKVTLDLNIDNADNYWHKTSSETWRPYATSVKLGSVWLSEDENVEITDLRAVLNNYIASESAKFITGRRPMSEIDEFWDELEQMDIDRYLEIYVNAYAPYMESVFGK
ncbi:MAG: hypothetical protein E7448_06805 [Ruminococcaceae bacterium]|nr:hypothetical protein [Oscillospiraceae bacterium]